MSSTQFWVALIVPPLIKWLMPHIRRYVKLEEFDKATITRITTKQYPAYYSFFYTLWILSLLSTGIIALLLIMIYIPIILPGKNYTISIFLGLINMLGVSFIAGAFLDLIYWQISPANFRDYVMFRQLKEGWGFNINQQISTLFKLGIVYYLITSPLIIFLLLI